MEEKYKDLIEKEIAAKDDIVSKINKWMGRYTDIGFDGIIIVRLKYGCIRFDTIVFDSDAQNIQFEEDMETISDSDMLSVEALTKIYDAIIKCPKSKLIFD